MDPIELVDFTGDKSADDRKSLLCCWLTDFVVTCLALWRYDNDFLVPVSKGLGRNGQEAKSFLQFVWCTMLSVKILITAVLLIATIMNTKHQETCATFYFRMAEFFVEFSIIFAIGSIVMPNPVNDILKRYAIMFGLESILPKISNSDGLLEAFADFVDDLADLIEDFGILDCVDDMISLLCQNPF